MLSDKPLHVRKRIALFWTGGIALVLIGVLVALYSLREREPLTEKKANPFGAFYKTISETTQSFFSGE